MVQDLITSRRKSYEKMQSAFFSSVGYKEAAPTFLSIRFSVDTDAKSFAKFVSYWIRYLDVSPISELPEEMPGGSIRTGYFIFGSPFANDHQGTKVEQGPNGHFTVVINGAWLIPKETDDGTKPMIDQFVEIGLGIAILVFAEPSREPNRTVADVCLVDPFFYNGYRYLLRKIANTYQETAGIISLNLADCSAMFDDKPANRAPEKLATVNRASVNKKRDELIGELAWSSDGTKLRTVHEVIASYPAAAREKGLPEEIGVGYESVKKIVRDAEPRVENGKKG